MNKIHEIGKQGFRKRVEKLIEQQKCGKCHGLGYDEVGQMIDSIVVECGECHGTGITGMPLLREIDGELSQWLWDPRTKTVENPKYGRIQVMAVCDPVTGKMRYEAPIYTESFGEIDVVANNEGEIAFVMQNRPAIIVTDVLNQKWKNSPPKVHELSVRNGMTMIEFPRGFSKGIMHEGEEETGFKIVGIDRIGNVNSNTAVFGTSPAVAVGKAYKVESDLPPDPGEKILNVLWAKPEEIREMDILCGFTSASLWLFRAWALRQSDPFWRNIGEKL